MQLRAFTEAQVIASDGSLNIHPRWEGFKIPYFTLDGKPRPDGFFRFRFTTDRPSRGWGSVAPAAKPRRYAQPPSSGVAAYFPPLLDWREVANTPSIPLTITEGELKSACVCSLGPPAIGLGGVNNWRTATMARDELLPELEEFKWHNRTVIILFDSNINRNAGVASAASMLASVLTMRGAVVKSTHPPSGPDDTDKHGLGIDDWLFGLPPSIDRTDELTKLLATAPDVEGNAALHAVNLELARVVASKDYVRLTDGRRFVKKELTEESEYGSRTYNVETLNGDQVVKKAIPTMKTWLTWRYCRELKSYVYRPGQPRLTLDGCYNTWAGWGVEPQPGDVAPFLRLLEHLMGNATLKERQWFLQWLAAPLQTPGLKLRNGVVLWGENTGTGKTAIGQTMRRIYGDNFGVIETKHFHSNFNSHVVGKQFILGDEISVTEKRSVSERLKSMLTQEQVLVEEKYQIPYFIEDHVNYYFTSNYPDAFYVEENDRRFFIHEVTSRPMSAAESRTYFDLWLPHGASALFDYLLNVDLAGFDPFDRPPLTAAKTEMIQMGVGDIRRWIEDAKRDPVGVLKQSGPLTTVARLVKKYRDETDKPMDAAWMGKELAKAGIRKAAGGSPNIRVDGRMTRVHIVGATTEEEDRLRSMRPIDVQRLLDAQDAEGPKAKFEADRQKARVQ